MKKLGIHLLALIGLSLAGTALAAPPAAGGSDQAITVTAPHPASQADLPAAIAGGRIETRRYLRPGEAPRVIRAALDQPRAHLLSDDDYASGREIGRPCETVRRVRVAAGGATSVFIVSHSDPRWPFRSEAASVAVASMPKALHALEAAGATIVAAPFTAGDQEVAMIRAVDGKLFEIHAPRRAALSKAKQRFGVTRAYEPIDTDRAALSPRSTEGTKAGALCGAALATVLPGHKGIPGELRAAAAYAAFAIPSGRAAVPLDPRLSMQPIQPRPL